MQSRGGERGRGHDQRSATLDTDAVSSMIPYGTDEVASAVRDAAASRGAPVDRLEVLADERTRSWTIRAHYPNGDTQRMTFPFASTKGISTPGEIASRFTSESWPFG
jgi:hypothetical protein